MTIFEILGRERQVGVHGFPVSVEMFVTDVGQLAEVEGEPDVGLVVWLCVVRELLVFEGIVDLFESHGCR